MTIEDSNDTQSGANGKAARFGRATAWFAAGALGATALTGVAMAATSDTESGEQSPQTQMEGRGGPGGMGGPGGRGRHPGGPGGSAMLHGEGVIEDKDGEYQNVATQKGEVTEVGEQSITVVSEDGHSVEYTVNGDTKVQKDHEDKSIGDINNGDTVRVMAKKDGENLTAVRVGAMSPEKVAEMEETRQRFQEYREQLRNGEIEELPEEMREFFQERREQFQKGETTES